MLFKVISDKISLAMRFLNLHTNQSDVKICKNIKGNENIVINGDNNAIDISGDQSMVRKQLINGLVVGLWKLDDNKKSEKLCVPILNDFEDQLHALRVDLKPDELFLQELVNKLFQALKSNREYPSLQVRELFNVFDPAWQQKDKIDFAAVFNSKSKH